MRRLRWQHFDSNTQRAQANTNTNRTLRLHRFSQSRRAAVLIREQHWEGGGGGGGSRATADVAGARPVPVQKQQDGGEPQCWCKRDRGGSFLTRKLSHAVRFNSTKKRRNDNSTNKGNAIGKRRRRTHVAHSFVNHIGRPSAVVRQRRPVATVRVSTVRRNGVRCSAWAQRCALRCPRSAGFKFGSATAAVTGPSRARLSLRASCASRSVTLHGAIGIANTRHIRG